MAYNASFGSFNYWDGVSLRTGIQLKEKDYQEPEPAPFFQGSELTSWSFWRAGIAEFLASFLFLYIAVAAVLGNREQRSCSGIGVAGVAWAFGGMNFVLVYCTVGISGGHINPAVTFAMFLARKVSVPRALLYISCQCVGSICGAFVVKEYHQTRFKVANGGANYIMHGYTKGDGFGAEMIGTFLLVYTIFSATDAKRKARDSHVPVLVPLPIGFTVFLVHLATIPITGTGINPARSLGVAVVVDKHQVWVDHWVFWVAPLLGASLATSFQQFVIQAIPFKEQKDDMMTRLK
eukprot:c34934_g1_i1 orf=235-1110(-)